MNAPAYILSDTTLTLFYAGTPVVAHNTHPKWEEILKCLHEGRYDEIPELARPVVAVIRFLDGDPDFTVDESDIKFKGDPVHPLITDRLLSHMKHGISTKPLANFTRRLANNPDYWVADQLYPFLEKGNLPLTEDGCFLAYKLVRDDYLDVHSGTVDYHVGNIVTMPRQKVDNDRQRTCSSGLHACSLEYLKSFYGDRLLAVKIDPADVVSVPADYDDTKLRCCRMEVVAELDRNLAAPAWDAPVFDYTNEDDYDDEEEDADDEQRWFVSRLVLDVNDGEPMFWDHVDSCWSNIAWTQDCGYDSWTNASDAADALRVLFDGSIEVTNKQ